MCVTLLAIEPSSNLPVALRPWVPMKIRSQPCFCAARMIASCGRSLSVNSTS